MICHCFRSRFFIFLWIAAALFASGCNSGKTEEEGIVVATAFSENLYLSELQSVFGPGMSKQDSFLIAKGYIDNWIEKQVLLSYADKTGIGNSDELQKKVENYRQDLMVHEYRKKMLSEKLDTLITPEESRAYYEAHPENFELKQNIIRFVFIKMPRALEDKHHYWAKFQRADPEELTNMAVLALKNGGNAFMDAEKWLAFDDILKVVPINTYNQESFINNNRIFKIDEAGFVWYIHILEFRIRDNISPYEFVKDNIHEILINQRKVKKMQELDHSMVQKAYKEGKVRINMKQYE